jgi:hypothetical protein
MLVTEKYEFEIIFFYFPCVQQLLQYACDSLSLLYKIRNILFVFQFPTVGYSTLSQLYTRPYKCQNPQCISYIIAHEYRYYQFSHVLNKQFLSLKSKPKKEKYNSLSLLYKIRNILFTIFT